MWLSGDPETNTLSKPSACPLALLSETSACEHEEHYLLINLIWRFIDLLVSAKR